MTESLSLYFWDCMLCGVKSPPVFLGMLWATKRNLNWLPLCQRQHKLVRSRCKCYWEKVVWLCGGADHYRSFLSKRNTKVPQLLHNNSTNIMNLLHYHLPNVHFRVLVDKLNLEHNHRALCSYPAPPLAAVLCWQPGSSSPSPLNPCDWTETIWWDSLDHFLRC